MRPRADLEARKESGLRELMTASSRVTASKEKFTDDRQRRVNSR